MNDPSKTFSQFSSIGKAIKVEDKGCIIFWYLLPRGLLRSGTQRNQGGGKGRTASREGFGSLWYQFGRRSFVHYFSLTVLCSMLYFDAIEKSKDNNVICSNLFRRH